MIRDITISNFRKFERFELNNLGRINILVGPNNTGKTTVLEGVFALCCGLNFNPFYNNIILSRRSNNDAINIFDLADSIDNAMCFYNEKYTSSFESYDKNGEFYKVEHTFTPTLLMSEVNSSISSANQNLDIEETDFNTQNGRVIQSKHLGSWIIANQANESVENTITFPPRIFKSQKHNYQARFNDTFAYRSKGNMNQVYSSLKRQPDIFKDFLSEVQNLFPEVKTFDMFPYSDGSSAPVSVIKKDESIVTINYFGDGFRRWFHLLGTMIKDKNSIQLVEEIDATFHYEAQIELSKNLYRYCDNYDTQLFASTHNLEFIDIFLKSIRNIGEEELENVRIITLKNSADGKTIARNLSGKEALELRNDFNMEIRK